jgi:small subunit ribosomal protein S17
VADKRKHSDEHETPVGDHVDSADAESTNESTVGAEETDVAGETVPADAEETEAEEPVVEVVAEAEQPAAEESEGETEAPAEATAPEETAAEPEASASAPAEAREAPAEAEAGAPGAAEPEASASAPAEAPAPAEAQPKPKKKRLPRRLRPPRTKTKVAKPETRKPIVRLEKPEHDRGRRQERQGTVVSSAMDKTIVVKVDVLKAHRRYKKVVRRSSTFHAHDEANQANVGDIVRIVETRPLSKTKRWRLAEIVEAAK